MDTSRSRSAGNTLLRVITTLCLVAAILHIIFRLPQWTFTLVVALFAWVGLIEFFAMADRKGIAFAKMFAIPWGVAISLSHSLFWDEVLLASGVLALFIYHFTKRETGPTVLLPIAVSLLGWVYIGWFLSFFNKIHVLPEGNLWLCFALFVAKVGDMGAYVIGSRYGKHPLIPRISPKKSVEGALGGFAFSVVIAIVFGILVTRVPFWHTLFLGILVGVIAQLGDLSESLIKREVGVKDSGGVLPGLGGMLDLLDSLLFTAPVVYLYLVLVMFR